MKGVRAGIKSGGEGTAGWGGGTPGYLEIQKGYSQVISKGEGRVLGGYLPAT